MVTELTLTEPDAFVLLTRFNLPSKGYESIVRSSSGWLEDRVALFERFCLPSVQAQTDGHFVWIIYFDPESPAWLMKKIEQWQIFPQLKAVFRDRVMLEDMRIDFEQALGHRPRRLITANLDNDDAIGRNFVSRLRAMAPFQGREALFLSNGLVLSGHRLFLNRDADNAFCCASEDWEGFVTCWAKPHTDLKHFMAARYLGGQPGWLQVIHGNNVSNRARGRRVSPAGFASEFTILGSLPPARRKELLTDQLWYRPQRWTREFTRAIVKKAVLLLLPQGGIDQLKVAKHAVEHALRKSILLFNKGLPGSSAKERSSESNPKGTIKR
jgi:hypothetical protein